MDIDNFHVLLTVCTGDDELFNVHTAVNVANELRNHTNTFSPINKNIQNSLNSERQPEKGRFVASLNTMQQ